MLDAAQTTTMLDAAKTTTMLDAAKTTTGLPVRRRGHIFCARSLFRFWNVDLIYKRTSSPKN
jgi:hypothetical protein